MIYIIYSFMYLFINLLFIITIITIVSSSSIIKYYVFVIGSTLVFCSELYFTSLLLKTILFNTYDSKLNIYITYRKYTLM